MLVSICIPTKDRSALLEETLISIFTEAVSKDLYEIVVSDNSDDNETLCVVEKFRALGMNIVYYKNPEKGFYNSIQALLHGNAMFLKLHNDYTKFKPGGFKQLIDLVMKSTDLKPQILFTDGNLKIKDTREYSNFDAFLASSSYWNTWSSAFSIWKADIDLLPKSKDVLNDQFPHTSLLFHNSEKDRFVLDDRVLFDNSKVPRKGGYNVFYNFCVLYIEMLSALLKKQKISETTYKTIKKAMGYQFVSSWYCNSVLSKDEFSFDNTNCHANILKYYTRLELFIIVIIALLKKAYKTVLAFMK